MAPKRPRKTKEDVDYAADQLSDDEFEGEPRSLSASQSSRSSGVHSAFDGRANRVLQANLVCRPSSQAQEESREQIEGTCEGESPKGEPEDAGDR